MRGSTRERFVFFFLPFLFSDDLGQSLMRHSRLYRACLGAHIAQLEGCIKSQSDAFHLNGSLPKEISTEYAKSRSRVAEYHVIWYLCEILYLSSDEEGSVTSQLLDWIHMTFYPNTVLLQQIQSQGLQVDGAVMEKLYVLVKSFVLQGCFKEAAVCLDLLAHHSKNSTEAKYLEVTSALLLEIPLVAVTTSIREFMPRFQLWQGKCKQLWEAVKFDHCTNVAQILGLMSGDEATLKTTDCSWVELVIAHLLYVDPWQKRSHLRELVHRCIVSLKGLTVDNLPPYQRILQAVFADDVILALKVAAVFTESWLGAHLTDLLFHADVLPEDGLQTRAQVLSTHCEDLKGALWSVALEYWSYSGSEDAREQMAVLVESQEATSEKEMRYLLSLCRRYGLDQSRVVLAKSFASFRWKKGQIRDAIEWAIEAGDDIMAAQMVFSTAEKDGLDAFVYEYNEIQEPQNASLLFVHCCVKLRQARSCGAHHDAARLLVRLICDRIAPRRFWVLLFGQCVPLFEESVLLWTLPELQLLMRRLETVVAPGEHQVLRLAICRCVSKTLVNE
jgi:hypothetical protein